jgi:hypothetical protein
LRIASISQSTLAFILPLASFIVSILSFIASILLVNVSTLTFSAVTSESFSSI